MDTKQTKALGELNASQRACLARLEEKMKTAGQPGGIVTKPFEERDYNSQPDVINGTNYYTGENTTTLHNLCRAGYITCDRIFLRGHVVNLKIVKR